MKKKIIISALVLSVLATSVVVAGVKPGVLANTNAKALTTAMTTRSSKNAPNQWHLTTMQTNEAVKLIFQKKKPIKIAVIDSGVNHNNPAISKKVDISLGYNAMIDKKNDKNNVYTMDNDGHGTLVTGLIVADGTNGIKGATGDLDVKIIPIKVMEKAHEGKGWTGEHLERAMKYAIFQKVDIINLSLGTTKGADFEKATEAQKSQLYSSIIEPAIKNGITVVIGSGNEGINTKGVFPASNKNAIVVGAVDTKKSVWINSNYGESVSVVAPGVYLYVLGLKSSYTKSSGTSHSTPLVTSTVAMIKASAPDLTPAQIKDIIQQSTDRDVSKRVWTWDNGFLGKWTKNFIKKNPLRDDDTGYGMVNSYKAIKYLYEKYPKYDPCRISR